MGRDALSAKADKRGLRPVVGGVIATRNPLLTVRRKHHQTESSIEHGIGNSVVRVLRNAVQDFCRRPKQLGASAVVPWTREQQRDGGRNE